MFLDLVFSMALFLGLFVKPQLSFVKYSKYTDGFGFVFQIGSWELIPAEVK